MKKENQNFYIEFVTNNEKSEYNLLFINKIFNKINVVRRDLLEKLEIETCRKVRIILFDDRERFINTIKKFYENEAKIPSYCRGTIQEGIIYFLINNKIEIDTYRYEIEMRKIIHEYIHIEYISSNDKRIVWIDEGIAQNFSNERRKIYKRKIYKYFRRRYRRN
ncbi:MAG: hypothetical protein IJE05_04510 [Clostridia bacterium]|nr:hypothetical protein [Clostridia bacterium]